MKTIKYYQICVEIFGGALKETNISFSKPEDAEQFVADAKKNVHEYCYKEVSKNIYIIRRLKMTAQIL